HTEVVPRDIAGDAAKDASKLAQLLRVDVGSAPCSYVPGLASRTALILTPEELIVANADGTSVQRRFKTTNRKYVQISERAGASGAVATEPTAVELLDKQTLKPIRSIKLPFAAVMSLAVHPFKKLSYVGIEQKAEGKPRYPVVIVDEAS